MTTPIRWLVLAAAVLAGGCASVVPETIRKPPSGDVRVAEARREPETFRGSAVRWGGAIVAVRNLRDETMIEIVARGLDSEGRPRDEDRTEGRFLAKVAGFLDPAIYAAGREVTVSGRLEGVLAQPIGDFSYSYPLVRADQVYLWQPRPAQAPYPYYDPFWWDPWYPWGYPYWPYHRPWYR
jgi:outer membrane lipoprotein